MQISYSVASVGTDDVSATGYANDVAHLLLIMYLMQVIPI